MSHPSVVSNVHYLLMERIDGPSADRFLAHIHALFRDSTAPIETWPLASQVVWMTDYWQVQISHAKGAMSAEALQIQRCRTLQDLLTCIDRSLIDTIAALDLPNVSAGIPPVSKLHTPNTAFSVQAAVGG